MRTLPSLLAAWVLAASAPASGEIYRWTDAAGREHFTSDLYEVPPEQRPGARRGGAVPGGTLNDFGGSGAGPRSASPSSRPSTGARSRVAPPAALGEAQPSESIGGRDEAKWRTEYERYVREIETLEQQVEHCEDERPPVVYNRTTGRRMDRDQVDARLASLETCGEARSNLGVRRTQLENFEEMARRLGVPPGWLR